MACIAFVLGFWQSLSSVSPRWADLLSRIEIAKTMPVQDGVHYGKLEAFNDWPRPTTLTYVVSIAITIVFYFSRRIIVRYIDSLDFRLLAYVVLVTLVLPYIYLNWTAWPAVNAYFLGNWIYVPVAVLAIPTVSFALDVRRSHPRTLSRCVCWSLAEILLITPIWSFLWTIVILFTGLIWV